MDKVWFRIWNQWREMTCKWIYNRIEHNRMIACNILEYHSVKKGKPTFLGAKSWVPIMVQWYDPTG